MGLSNIMIKKRDLLVMRHLRQNARKNVTDISKETGIPPSTIYDKLKSKYRPFQKFIAIVDFSKIGFNSRNFILVKILDRKRDEFENYLTQHQNINNVFKMKHGHDYLIETLFNNQQDACDFNFDLKTKFSLINLESYPITDEIVRENFFTKKEHVDLVKLKLTKKVVKGV